MTKYNKNKKERWKYEGAGQTFVSVPPSTCKHWFCRGQLGQHLCEMHWIFFLSVMCSFSCWLVIQSLVVSAPCSMFWSLQSMSIERMFQIYRRTAPHASPSTQPAPRPDRLLSVAGANPKKPSAPDMFTESDDLFAADFDVSFHWRGRQAWRRKNQVPF